MIFKDSLRIILVYVWNLDDFKSFGFFISFHFGKKKYLRFWQKI